MAIVRNPTAADSPVSYIATIAFFCCVSCVVLMMRFQRFRASLNFGSKKNKIDKEEEQEHAPESSISGSYRTNRDELYNNGSLPDEPKKLTPSMVVLPLSNEDKLQPMRPMRPAKSTSDLMPGSQPPPPQHPKLAHSVSHDPRGPTTSQPANAAPAPERKKKNGKKDAKNQKDVKNQKIGKNKKDAKNQPKPWTLKDAEILQKKLEDQMEKRRLAQLKEKEKEQARREKVKREKEKKEAQERAKAEKMNNKKKKSVQQPAANPLAHPQGPGLTRPAPGPGPAPGPPKQAPGPAPGPSRQAPSPAPPPQPSSSYGTNTLESSISRSSGPPPYAETPTNAGNSNPSNVTFGKSIDKPADSWDLISQHRQQLARPASTGVPKGQPKSKVMDLQYKLGNDDSNSEV